MAGLLLQGRRRCREPLGCSRGRQAEQACSSGALEFLSGHPVGNGQLSNCNPKTSRFGGLPGRAMPAVRRHGLALRRLYHRTAAAVWLLAWCAVPVGFLPRARKAPAAGRRAASLPRLETGPRQRALEAAPSMQGMLNALMRLVVSLGALRGRRAYE